MSDIYPGAVLRVHDDEGYRDIGRVVHVSDDKTYYWWIAFPQSKSPKARTEGESAPAPTDKSIKAEVPGKKKGRLQPYIKRPRVAKIADAVEQIGQGLPFLQVAAIPVLGQRAPVGTAQDRPSTPLGQERLKTFLACIHRRGTDHLVSRVGMCCGRGLGILRTILEGARDA